ncbi:heparinase II/III family protein [bacterium]|nr:heparinase II/III family protein [bacterium]MBU1958928.1 heparinase II/III family protein [bacterium]
MNIDNSIRLYNTVKFLKAKQIYYRLYYLLRNRSRKLVGLQPLLSKNSNATILKLEKSIHITDCYFGDREFKFLNLSKTFEDHIDWNHHEYGKLWTYNLSYFDFLTQNYSDKHLELIKDFISNLEHVKDGLEPFPLSLRGINWIKFLSYNKIQDKEIDDALYAQYYLLFDNVEYHLLGNHLLENGFSLLFGAYYFQDEQLYSKAKTILLEELEEQILRDGAHFELSPMYHQIMLFRLIDCINLIQNNDWKQQELLEFLTQKAEMMLGWIKVISYKDGSIPLLNDSANNIAPTTEALLGYAQRLNLTTQEMQLRESGYRKFSTDVYEMVLDVGNIGPDYIPGHAHSDTFSFELRREGKPFIVDTGLSTYESNARRTLERSTVSHNTVEINGQDQSEVWGGFRVANRARVIHLKEDDNFIEATHDGYKSDTIWHTRKWTYKSNTIVVEDDLNKTAQAIARFHFHPDIEASDILNAFNLGNNKFKIARYKYAAEFNKEIDAYVLEVAFSKSLKVEIVVP